MITYNDARKKLKEYGCLIFEDPKQIHVIRDKKIIARISKISRDTETKYPETGIGRVLNELLETPLSMR